MLNPFNLTDWIKENKDKLVPPIGNKNLYTESQDYIVMIVAGPNMRKDFHYNETEELFYQLEGTIDILIQENNQCKTITLNKGDMYLNPPKVPHSPIRYKDSLGLVIERKRAGKGFKDGLQWYCENCNNKLHETYFELKDIERDFLPHFKNFYTSNTLRVCNKCNTEMEADKRFTT